ncbi:hypothetical protein RCL1_004378 [Eukaryota sp. TZLM3-RCL]
MKSFIATQLYISLLKEKLSSTSSEIQQLTSKLSSDLELASTLSLNPSLQTDIKEASAQLTDSNSNLLLLRSNHQNLLDLIEAKKDFISKSLMDISSKHSFLLSDGSLASSLSLQVSSYSAATALLRLRNLSTAYHHLLVKPCDVSLATVSIEGVSLIAKVRYLTLISLSLFGLGFLKPMVMTSELSFKCCLCFVFNSIIFSLKFLNVHRRSFSIIFESFFGNFDDLILKFNSLVENDFHSASFLLFEIIEKLNVMEEQLLASLQ